MANPPLKALVLEQSAHCDWDWLVTFNEYFLNGHGDGSSVRTILDTAIDYVSNTDGYIYVFCEVGYLQAYFDSNPPSLQLWKDAIAAGTFRFSSGGITSADNLNSHTEAFIRNYLFGRQWLKNTLGATASLRMWVPDDFGHDAQLPVLLNAMGYTGVAFARIPVAGPEEPSNQTFDGVEYTITASGAAPTSFLVAGDEPIGPDFNWQAADTSTVQAHWLMNWYGEGDKELGDDPQAPDVNGLQKAVDSYGNVSAAGIAFVPIDNDFSLPYYKLPAALKGFQYEGVTASLGTFDDYLTSVAASRNLRTLLSNSEGDAFVPNPYYSGCCASQPQLKQLHYATTRALLAAETMALLLQILAAQDDSYADTAAWAAEAIAAAWMTLLPSTHHDYVTGTAPNNVIEEEQLPRLQAALQAATAAQSYVLDAVAGAINLGAAPSNGPAYAVFNPAAVPGDRLAQLPQSEPANYLSSTIDGQSFYPIQTTTEGTSVLAMVPVPSMGYQTVWLTGSQPGITLPLSVTDNGDGSFTLDNAALSAVVTVDGITGLFDASDPSVNVFAGGIGNQLVYYADTGSIYRFASEVPWASSDMTFAPVTSSLADTHISITEHGPLRVSVKVTASVTVDGQTAVPLTTVYSLVANEPFLRITTTSSAPGSEDANPGYSVMVSFPFAAAGDMASLAYGTTSHWDRQKPRQWFDWNPPAPSGRFDFLTFEPAHDWIIPYDSEGSILGAVFHASSPAWAISADGTSLYGCILRNTPQSAGNGAAGWDTSKHTVSYAVTVPNMVADPLRGAGVSSAFMQSLYFNNPTIASAAVSGGSALPLSVELLASGDDQSLITVAKMGTADPSKLIVRVYQPTNSPITAAVVLDASLAALHPTSGAMAVTAMEDAAADNVTVTAVTETALNVVMQNAWATIAL